MSLFSNTNLFLNTTVNKIDGKGRISFPASFRTALSTRGSAGVVLYQSLTHNAIEGWPAERMQTLSESLDGLDVFSDARAEMATAIFGTAQDLALDSEGRCTLPRGLCDFAGITTEAAFLGQGETFQIWEPGALLRHTESARAALKQGKTPLLLRKGGV
jgi:MraZ protein